jgi:hypothetical protein
MFVDESGNHDLNAVSEHRYLCLIGLIFREDHERDLSQELAELKFVHFGDFNVILHRHELVNRKPPFDCLREKAAAKMFNDDLAKLVESLDYTALSVVIDKLEFVQRYKVWRKDPITTAWKGC